MADPEKEEGKKPDEKLPESKIDERVAELVEELRADRVARAAAVEPEKPAPQERIYTAAELERFVESGKITQAEATEYLATVKAQQIVAESEKKLRAELAAERARESTAARIDAYREALPELRDKKSEEFAELREAYLELLAEGKPKGEATELEALRITFGRDPKKLRGRAAPRETTSERQRSVESAGARGDRRSSSGGGARSSGLPEWLEPERAAHYEKAIQKGIYKGAKDPNLVKELEILEKRRGAA